MRNFAVLPFPADIEKLMYQYTMVEVLQKNNVRFSVNSGEKHWSVNLSKNFSRKFL